MKIADLVHQNRSYRRFDEATPIPHGLLEELVELARICPSTANRQPLKFIIADTPEKMEAVFPTLAWAAYIKEWDGPEAGERPTAYIIILTDTAVFRDAGVDPGICAQTMLLAATEQGFGGCMIANVKKEALKKSLGLSEELEVSLVIALGKPAEEVILEETGKDGSIRYYRDESGRHHVPKRPLGEILLD